MKRYKNSWLLLFFSLFAITALAQESSLSEQEITQINQDRLTLQKQGMYVLGGWALANFAYSGASLQGATGSTLRFHQMNILWNTVNAGLAGAGLYAAITGETEGYTTLSTWNEYRKTEKILLLNTGLDAAYIMSGIYLLEKAKTDEGRANRWKGYGRSLILQGSFLMLFDTGLFYLTNRQANRHIKLDNSGQAALHIRPGGLTLSYRF